MINRIASAWMVCVALAYTDAAHAQSSVPDPTSPFLPLEVLAEVTYPATGNRYQLLSITDYLNANKFAEDNGGWLWSVNDINEMNFVIDAFLPSRQTYLDEFADGVRTIPAEYNNAFPDGDFYIGFTDSEFFGATEGNFQWINGDPVTFTNWAGGEPNNVGEDADPNGEDYAEIWNLTSSRNWNDDNDRDSGLNGLPNQGRLPAGGNLAVVEFDPVPPPAHLEIDPATGFARLVSDVEDSFTLFSYELRSDQAGLSSTAWQSTNLSSSTDEGSPGMQWEAISSDSGQLFEGFLLGGTEIPVGESLLLGKVTDPFDIDNHTHDFVLDFATSNLNPNIPGAVTAFDVPVEYKSFIPGGLPGDYSANGVVDAADYSLWRDAFGSTSDLAADGDGNGVINSDDYRVWSGQYGATASASTAVPEPTTAAAAIACLGILIGQRKSHRINRV